jgi:glycerol-3-phosphate acyltransferase PlsY
VGVGYLCGALPWGLWLGARFRGVDVRTLGSGNLGATNVFRLARSRPRHRDAAARHREGRVPVWLLPRLAVGRAFPGGPRPARSRSDSPRSPVTCGPASPGFKGGKGVATTVGVLLAVAPRAFLVFIVVFRPRGCDHALHLGRLDPRRDRFALALALPGRQPADARVRHRGPRCS